MCGIVGIITAQINGFSNADMNILYHSMFLNQLRGSDSTGMFSVEKTGVVDVIKSLGHPGDLYNNKDWEKFKKRVFSHGKIVIGHGRSATRGEVVVENAHPLIAQKKDPKENIILVHNGTLGIYQTLPGFHEHDVDSGWLADCIAKYGPKETLSKVRGAIACIWWDEAKELLYFYRNHERPLHIAIDKTGLVLISSESAPLAYLQEKYGLSYPEGILQFNPNMLCWISLKNIFGIKKITDLSSEEIKPAPYMAPTYSHDLFGSFPWTDISTMEGTITDLIKGSLLRVSWKNSVKTSKISKYGLVWDSVESGSPYEENLISMELSPENKNLLLKTYQKEGTSYVIETLLDKETGKDVILLPRNKKEVLSGIVFRKNKGTKFSTLNVGKKITHRALSGDIHEKSFVKYQNNIDGKFEVGDKDIIMEAYDVEPATGKVSGFLTTVNNKISSSIDVFFFDKELTPDTIYSIGLFGGKIKSIELVDDEFFERTKAVVRILIEDVVPLRNLGTEVANVS